MRISYLLLATCLSACTSCEDKQADGTTTTGTTAANTSSTPGCPPARTPDDWHTVDSLFIAMGGVNGKTVADLFVGDGYYTMKLLEAGAKVIAMDDDPRNIEALEAKKKEMGICDERLVIRTSTPGAPNLSLNEVDVALCTRQLLSIPDRLTSACRRTA
jgi:predicted methyltransferase